jgi:apolipoprotein N-acyltransferase
LFRGLENRVAMVAAGNDFSAITDSYGRIIAGRVGAPGEEGEPLVGDVSLGRHNSIYSWVGDWVGWLALVGLVFVTVLPEALKRRAAMIESRAAVLAEGEQPPSG